MSQPTSPTSSLTNVDSEISVDGRSSTDDIHSPYYYRQRHNANWKLLVAAGMAACACFSLSAFALADTFIRTNTAAAIQPVPARRSLGACGKNAAEARARGCHFDIMVASWVRPECWDRQLHHDYVHRGVHEQNWTFWREPEALSHVELEEVQKGEWTELHVTASYHYAHCAYFWDRQWAQFRLGGTSVVLDERTRKDGHTQHCMNGISKINATKIAEVAPVTMNQQWDKMECIIGPM
jgi:hypothetical protein